ncbi:MAG: response regulator [Victivallaceae bacterium]
MNIKNLRIGTQLKLGFATMLIMVIILGVISHVQNEEMGKQTQMIYNHPLQVQRAARTLQSDVFAMHLNMKDLLLANNENDIEIILKNLELLKADSFEQIKILYSQYLGNKVAIDTVNQEFIAWNSIREETIRMLRAGKKQEAADRTKKSGVGGIQAAKVISVLEKVNTFVWKKADELNAASLELNDWLNKQLAIWVTAIVLFAVIINLVLMRNIRTPLKALIDATQRFRNGETDARCSYSLQNEFGLLSTSFNALADNIQQSMDLNEKIEAFSKILLSENEAKKFFSATLTTLLTNTNSSIAAVYLLNHEQNIFEHFASIGLDNNARQPFSAATRDGEFGAVLSTHKIQHIKNIPDDTRFVFNAVSGNFIPREIMTIPLYVGNKTIAIISLASFSQYSAKEILFIYNILGALTARVEGILTYRKIRKFSEKMAEQNRELEAQQKELSAQSAELIEQNTELEMQKNQLNEVSELKTNFLSNMSHELRTPLNSVIALSGVLNRRLINQIPQEEYSYLEVIERNGKHLLQLINDILDISRIEAGREEMEITKFNANNLIADVVSMIDPQAEQKNIELLHLDSNAELLITSDADKCRHILQNLIGNAVKFTEKGKVEVAASQSDNHITIKVTDTGIGISEENLARVFDKFRQADGSTSRKFGGTGLGLAIAQELSMLLGGTISVNSVPDQGSEFTLSLPLRYTGENKVIETETTTGFKKASTSAAPMMPTVYTSQVKTVLLVEDSEPAIIQMKDILEANGYQLLIAHDGTEALKIIEKTIPDAMILDLMMPEVDGFEVLKTLREADKTAHIPVLILTAKHITKDELKFLKRNNIHQLIQKGDINRNELLNTISDMVFPQREKPLFIPQVIEGKPVVLVVEDNPDNMTTVKALLGENYTIVEAVDGNDGVKKAKTHKPNLVLMDISLPAMDGIEAFREIKNIPELHHIPVIALTASAMVNDRETILAQGFDAYISKPIDQHIFFKTINETLYGK